MINDGKTVPLSQGREPSQTTPNQSKTAQCKTVTADAQCFFLHKKEEYLIVNNEFSSAESV